VVTVWHSHALAAFVLPLGVAAFLADRFEAGFAELLEDLAGGFVADHVGQSREIDGIKSIHLDVG